MRNFPPFLKGDQGGLRVICYSSPFTRFRLMHMGARLKPCPTFSSKILTIPCERRVAGG